MAKDRAALPDPRPFVGIPWAAVVLPDENPDAFGSTSGFVSLLRNERAELAAELGCPVRIVPAGDWSGAPAACLIGPGSLNPAIADAGYEASTGPVVIVDRSRSLVVVDGRTIGEVGEAMQLLREAIGSSKLVTVPSFPDSPEAIIDRLEHEVGQSYPAFALRQLNWDEITQRHRPLMLASGASLESLQCWFAELQDAHTWVKSPAFGARLPYQAWIDSDTAYLTYVPTWSSGWTAGARAGDLLLDCERDQWWQRTAATPRSRTMVTGYRWFSGEVGTKRRLRVQSANGHIVEWEEEFQGLPWKEPISWHLRPTGTGYLRIRGWHYSEAWTSLLEAAFRDLAECPRLLVDLRGNSGGSLVAAQAFRNRFLTKKTLIGGIQFSIGNTRLSEPESIEATPPGEGTWHKPVRFLTDRLTYSASEDAILGLGELSHVEIVGEPSGGGSGRPRTIMLKEDLWATISTALTFDQEGHCVEGQGLPVHMSLPIDEHLRHPIAVTAADILAMADEDW